MEATVQEQEKKMDELESREKERLTMSLMPRGDLDQEGEDRLKQMALVRKIHLNCLLRRLRDDQKRADKLTAAYDRIRSATGLEDVSAVIVKFQGREEAVANLHSQMRAARDKVDALQAEKRKLIWQLDEASAVQSSSTDARSLYRTRDEFERALSEADRRYLEAKHRLNKVSLVLEACRSSISTMLERTGLDASVLSGVVAGSAAAVGGEGPLSPVFSASSAAQPFFGGISGGGAGGGDVGLMGDLSVMPSAAMTAGGEDSMVVPGSASGSRRGDSASASSSASASRPVTAGSGFAAAKGSSIVSRGSTATRPGSRLSGLGAGGAGARRTPSGSSVSPARQRPGTSGRSAGAGAVELGGSSDSASKASRGAGAGAGIMPLDIQAATSSTLSAAAGIAAAGIGGAPGEVVHVVQPEDLENALSSLEERLQDVLSHLAFVCEREEVALASISGKGVGKLRFGGGSRRAGGGKGSFSSAMSSVVSGGMSTAGSEAGTGGSGGGGGGGILGGAAGGAGGGGLGGAGGTAAVLSTLVERAGSRMFVQRMTAQLDTSENNVRVDIVPPTMHEVPGGPSYSSASSASVGPETYRTAPASTSGGGVGAAPSGTSPYGNYGSAIRSRAAQRKAEMEGIQRILKGEGAGAVVDRESLKRLSNIVTASFQASAAAAAKNAEAAAARNAEAGEGKPTSPGGRSPARGGGGSSSKRPASASASKTNDDDDEGNEA
jgi:hypothetical protein